MLIRQHRGGLAESMDTVETIEPTRVAIAAWAARAYNLKCRLGDLEIKPYAYDARISWNTYLVSLNGYGVLGMCNQEVT